MKPIIEHDNYYHIYNRGNNYEDIFREEKDYLHFLDLLEIYILPVAEIYAWCLMKNHFHLLVRIKEDHEIGYLNLKNVKSEDSRIKWKTYQKDESSEFFKKKPNPIQQFKHIFNSYSSWFNRKHGRRGSLFEFNYKRKLVNNQKQLINIILYIHFNPVHHGFVNYFIEYPWSSYFSVFSDENSLINKNDVIKFFEDEENFKYMHKSKMNTFSQTLEGLEME